MLKKYDIAVSMGTYFDDHWRVNGEYRRELYLACIESLKKVNWLGTRVVLVLRDDCSTIPPERPEIVGVDVDYLVRPKRLGSNESPFLNLQQGILEAGELGYWVLWLDSDGLVAHDCIKRLFDLVHVFPSHPAYGAFNSPVHEVLEDHRAEKPGYVLKRSLTEHGTLFRSADLRSFDRGFWSGLCARKDNSGYFDFPKAWPCLAPSGIQHTGIVGVNNPKGEDFDVEFVL